MAVQAPPETHVATLVGLKRPEANACRCLSYRILND